VSVVIAVRNGEAYLAQAIDSILRQTLQPSQILIIDGASTDRTAQIARSYGQTQYLLQETNGVANARNQGILQAEGEFIAFLDHDDVWAPRKLEIQLSRMCEKPALGYTTTQMMFVKEESERRAPEWEWRPAGQPRSAPTPSALVARRAVFEHVGGFDPQYAIGCDADWFARARDANVPAEELPEVLLFKRLHESNLSLNGATNRQEMLQIARQSILRRAGKQP
jgi:glycosyltransferase involved in cell wall biosynthesis